MHKVLMLCYFFPPLGGGGVQRSVKFAKFLPETGWEPVVITVKPNLRNSIEQSLDHSLIEDIPENTQIIRCTPIELSVLYYLLYRMRLRKLLFEFERMIPLLHMDYKIGFYPIAVKHGVKAIKKGGIEVIYSTFPPVSGHLAARELKRRFGLPWIADFRDPGTLSATYRPVSKLHDHIDKKIEKSFVQESDVVIANTEINKENLIREYMVRPEKVKVIPNGFDPSDFIDFEVTPSDRDRFTVTCTGKYYEMSDPGVFFRAFRKFNELRRKSFLSLIGWHSRIVEIEARTSMKPGTWESKERLSHKDAILAMKKSAVLIANLPSEKNDHWIPGKLFEYLAAKRPILLLGPENGDAAEIVKRTGTGVCVGFNEDKIIDALEYYYLLWEKEFEGWNPRTDYISNFDRKLQAQELASIFDSVALKKTDRSTEWLTENSARM